MMGPIEFLFNINAIQNKFAFFFFFFFFENLSLLMSEILHPLSNPGIFTFEAEIQMELLVTKGNMEA